jgi:hypothetical protein
MSRRSNRHIIHTWSSVHTFTTNIGSSDEESPDDRRHKRRQREHGDDHDQPHGSSGTSQTTQDGTSPMDAASIELTHEQKRFLDPQDGGVTVNASVCLRKNPARRARPKAKEETKRPERERATKGPIFKGTYMPKIGTKGGGLKYMIRLGG